MPGPTLSFIRNAMRQVIKIQNDQKKESKKNPQNTPNNDFRNIIVLCTASVLYDRMIRFSKVC